MKRSTLFFALCCAFLIGVAVQPFVPVQMHVLGISLIVFGIAGAVSRGLVRDISLCILSVLLGVARAAVPATPAFFSLLLEPLAHVRIFLEAIVQRALPEPQAGLAAGLLFGDSHALSPVLRDWCMRTGTMHMVAASGTNVTIIIAALSQLVLGMGLPRKKSYLIIGTGIILFALLTGAQASIVRASIFGGVVLLGQWIGRKKDPRNALAFTAALMVALEPQVLSSDVGFQLSFLATLGIVYIQPLLERFFFIDEIGWRPLRDGVGKYLIPTMAAMIATQPLVFHVFGGFSFVAPLANILALPAVPLAMLLGSFVVLGGLIHPFAAQVFGWAAWVLLRYMTAVLEWSARIPGAYQSTETSTALFTAIIYALITGAVWLGYRYMNTVDGARQQQ